MYGKYAELPRISEYIVQCYFKFRKNDTFSIIGECNGWYFILHNGITGYVLSDYVEVIDSGDLSPIKVGELAKCCYNNAGGSEFQNGALCRFLNHLQAGSEYAGNRFSILFQANGVWYYIRAQ